MEMFKEVQVRDFHSVNVIPDWIYKYLSRKGIGGDHLFGSAVLDDRLSTEDIATILYLNSYIPLELSGSVKNLMLSSCDLHEEIYRMKSQDNPGLTSKIDTAMRLMHGKELQREINERLEGVSEENNPLCSETSSSYDFVVTGPKIWLVIKPGFFKALKDPKERLKLYRDYLSTVGKVASFSSVTWSDVFMRYVEEIAG